MSSAEDWAKEFGDRLRKLETTRTVIVTLLAVFGLTGAFILQQLLSVRAQLREAEGQVAELHSEVAVLQERVAGFPEIIERAEKRLEDKATHLATQLDQKAEAAVGQHAEAVSIRLDALETRFGDISLWGVNSANQVFLSPDQGLTWIQPNPAARLKQISIHGTATWGVNATDQVFVSRDGGLSWIQPNPAARLKHISTWP